MYDFGSGVDGLDGVVLLLTLYWNRGGLYEVGSLMYCQADADTAVPVRVHMSSDVVIIHWLQTSTDIRSTLAT